MSVTDHNATNESSLLGHSPVGWRVDRIRDHLSGIVGGEWGDDPDAHDEGVELPVIRVADIRDLDLTVEGLTIRRIKESKITGRLIGKQTILIEKSGGGENKPVGRAVRTNMVTFDAICSNFMAKVDCGDTVAPAFVVYTLDALYSSGVNGACIQQTTGIQNLRVLDYLNTKVAIPPLPEQQRIAAYLDASCAAIDAAVYAKRRQVETLDALRKTTIHRAVTQGLNRAVPKKTSGMDWFAEVPAHWCIDRIRDRLGEIVGGEWGDDPDAHDEGVALPVIRVADIRGLELTIEGLTIRRIKESKLNGRLIGKQTILLEKSGGGENKPVGRAVGTNNVKFDAICSNFMAKVDCGDTVTPSFVVYLLDAMYSSGVNTSCIQQTTGIQNLRVTDYLNTKVGIPSMPEQEQIVAYLDAKEREFISIVRMLESQIATLSAYRKSLIHECVTGQRRVTEADVVRSQLSENIGQPKLESSENVGQLRQSKTDGSTPIRFAQQHERNAW